MDDPGAVSRIQAIGDFAGQRKERLDFQRAPAGGGNDTVLQGRSIQELHDDVRAAVLLADIINRTDVGVIQGGSGASLALKTTQGLRIAGEGIRQEFERDKAVQARIFGFIDHAHPSSAQLFDNAVMGDRVARGEAGIGD